MDEILRSYMPPMLTGSKLDEALRIKPEYSESIRKATEAERLIALQDLYSVYIPTDMSREVYSKLYLAMLHDYLYQEPVQAKKKSSRKNNSTVEAAPESKEQNLITEIVTRAKRLQKDIVEELAYYGVQITEVAV